jgi:hypothetical protein
VTRDVLLIAFSLIWCVVLAGVLAFVMFAH